MSSAEQTVSLLRDQVIEPLKRRFVGRDEVIELIALAIVAGEHLFLHGPPGTAKSAIIRQFAIAIRGSYFEYLLTRFSEPNEIFGPVDLARLREGVVATVTSGMLPEADVIFLDELFNANSAILNNLLTVLNERVYRRGAETHRLPMLSLFSASNHLPEEDALRALFDRFLLRCHVENLRREELPALLTAGWALEKVEPLEAMVSAADLGELTKHLYEMDLAPVREAYTELLLKVRDLGVAFSDRRAVKVLKLIAASALLCGRRVASPADLWVLRYVWDRQEQIDPLAALVNGVLKRADEPQAHALARPPERVDPEELARQVESLETEAQGDSHTVAKLARLRERSSDLANRCAWVTDPMQRQHLLNRTGKLLKRLG
jgi:MoxR-like ATPase